MKNNFKGTQGLHTVIRYDKNSSGNAVYVVRTYIRPQQKTMAFSAGLIEDAFLVRQKINCSLPELLNDYNSKESALKILKGIFEGESMIDAGQCRRIINEALNK